MKEIKNELENIYALVSSLSVSGEAVDVVAVVREKLRKLFKSAAEMEKEQEAAGMDTLKAEKNKDAKPFDDCEEDDYYEDDEEYED